MSYFGVKFVGKLSRGDALVDLLIKLFHRQAGV
jgi:hypothetical protein